MANAHAQSILLRLTFSSKFQEKQLQSKLGLPCQWIDNWVNLKGESIYLQALAHRMRMLSMRILHFTTTVLEGLPPLLEPANQRF
jgi:hypothetical protein